VPVTLKVAGTYTNQVVNITNSSTNSLLKKLKLNDFLKKTSNNYWQYNSMIIDIIIRLINPDAGFERVNYCHYMTKVETVQVSKNISLIQN